MISAQEAHMAYAATNFPTAERECEQRDKKSLKEFLELRQHRPNSLSTSSTAETKNKNYFFATSLPTSPTRFGSHF